MEKCPECGGVTIEVVSVKNPDIITIPCFKCGVVIRSFHKDNPEVDIKVEGINENARR